MVDAGDSQLASYIMPKVATTSGDPYGDSVDSSSDEYTVSGNKNAQDKREDDSSLGLSPRTSVGWKDKREARRVRKRGNEHIAV